MRIFPLGDSALTIEFGNEILPDVNARAICLARRMSEEPLEGLIEAVPAYASITAFYDPAITNYSAFERAIRIVLENLESAVSRTASLVEIPIIVSPETSSDLSRVAHFGGMSDNAVLDLFLSQTYRVYMLGFLPGFAYMGEVDDRIAAPRLETPRTKVPQGSIGIAGKQTGIYPLESPGGWNIIGRTDLRMFDPTAEPPCLLKPGDEVRFVRC